MKASELRYGNWVKRDTQPDGFQIDYNSFGTCMIHPSWYEPIPLTKAWFSKFGFEHRVTNNDDYFAKGGQCFCFETYFYLYIPEKKTVLGTRNPIKYVHQLQNIYFALTGEELSIN